MSNVAVRKVAVVAVLVETTGQKFMIFHHQNFVPDHTMPSSQVASLTRVAFYVSIDSNTECFKGTSVLNTVPMKITRHFNSYDKEYEMIIEDDNKAEAKFSSAEIMQLFESEVTDWFVNGLGQAHLSDRAY